MKKPKLCPKCGKKMEEKPDWPGLLMCPDYNIVLNDAPPYKFKCTGMEVTARGAMEFDKALVEAITRSN